MIKFSRYDCPGCDKKWFFKTIKEIESFINDAYPKFPEEFRVTSRKRIEESNEIIRRETQRMADIREQGRLFDIQFAEDMKKYEDVFKFNFQPRRFTGT